MKTVASMLLAISPKWPIVTRGFAILSGRNNSVLYVGKESIQTICDSQLKTLSLRRFSCPGFSWIFTEEIVWHMCCKCSNLTFLESLGN